MLTRHLPNPGGLVGSIVGDVGVESPRSIRALPSGRAPNGGEDLCEPEKPSEMRFQGMDMGRMGGEILQYVVPGNGKDSFR